MFGAKFYQNNFCAICNYNYNHRMDDTNLANQLITYYRPNLYFCQIWMPMFFDCFDVIKVNFYNAGYQFSWV